MPLHISTSGAPSVHSQVRFSQMSPATPITPSQRITTSGLPATPADGTMTADVIVAQIHQLEASVLHLGDALKDGGKYAKKVENIKDVLISRRAEIADNSANETVSKAMWDASQAISNLDAKTRQLKVQSMMLASTKRRKFEKRWIEVYESCNNLLIHLSTLSQHSPGALLGSPIPFARHVDEPVIDIESAMQASMWGERFLFGYGVARSFDTAFKHFTAAADFGLPEAMNMIGTMFEHGLGQEVNLDAALKWYAAATEKDLPEGINNLARLYELGKGCPKDIHTAFALYKKAADMAHVDAMTSLGHAYEKGLGTTVDFGQAFKWYMEAAQKGYARAQNFLGSMYYAGKGVNQQYDEAVRWYKKAAAQGNPHAQNNLGICFEEGKGVPRDYVQAKSYYREASQNKHHPHACNNLGYILLLEKNYDEAVKMFHLAISLGNVDAYFNLGMMYETGVGVQQDRHFALKYYQSAAKAGYEKAQTRLIVLQQHMGHDLPEPTPIHNIAESNGNITTRSRSSKMNLAEAATSRRSRHSSRKSLHQDAAEENADRYSVASSKHQRAASRFEEDKFPLQTAKKAEEDEPWLAELESYANDMVTV